MSKGVGGHQLPYQGKTDEWLTPPEILNAMGPFDLDPCSPINRPFPTAKYYYTKDNCELSGDWFGRVWLNPPYGPSTGKWLKRLAMHQNGIALIFARTETAMFHSWVWEKCHSCLFLLGRIHFHHVDGSRAKFNAGAPSVLVAYGSNNGDVLKQCPLPGKFVMVNG